MIEIYQRVDLAICNRLVGWLESNIKHRLKPDVSNYAKGRLRVWLGDEPSLTAEVSHKAGFPLSYDLKLRLEDIIKWPFRYALVTYSGSSSAIGISAHRDARYADYEAVGFNVSGTCDFSYWEGRKSFSKAKSVKEHNTLIDAPTTKLILQPGDCVRFNCKNLHSVAPSIDRWNINFWRASNACV